MLETEGFIFLDLESRLRYNDEYHKNIYLYIPEDAMKLNFKSETIGKICDIILLIPIFFAAAVIPLIVRIIFYNPKLSEYAWFPQETNSMDMFMYYKNQAMILLDAVLVVLFVILLFRKRLPAKAAFVPLGIYFILILLSAIFSVVPEQTWSGFYGMMESAFALFGYCMICYYVFAVVHTEWQLKAVICMILIGIFLLCAIGVSQFVGHDFYMSDFGKDLIFPQKFAGFKKYLGITFEVGRVYTSLYNPNYVGVYACIVIPFLMVLSFTMQKKRFIPVYLILAAMILACMTGCRSKTATIIVAFVMILTAFYFGKRHWKKMIPVYIVYIALFAALNVYASTSVFQETIDRFTAGYGSFADYNLKSITLNDEDFNLVYNDINLTVQYLCDEQDSWSIHVMEDETEIPAIFTDADNGFRLDDSRFDELEFIFGADEYVHPGFAVESEGYSFFIYYDTDQSTYLYTNKYGNASKIYASESIDCPLFHVMGGLTGRGFIWSKSLPILKNTIILGSGPDTYAFMFPQYDYVSLAQNRPDGQIITKPHNIYLQIAIQTGVLSLIAFLVFYLWYFVTSIKLYWKRTLTSFAERVGASIFIASICFMFAGLLNDSSIGVSVLFWSLLGLGFVCNQMVSRQTVEENN